MENYEIEELKQKLESIKKFCLGNLNDWTAEVLKIVEEN